MFGLSPMGNTPGSSSGGNLTNILSALQNGVQAINNVANALLRGQGKLTSETVSASTLVVSGKGYLVNFSVIDAGSSVGKIHNAGSIETAASQNSMVAVPNTAETVAVSKYFDYGIVIIPGSGQTLNVTYSLDITQ